MRESPEAKTLFDRATESGKETRQAILTMSSASLAVFFFALTTKIDPELTVAQQWTVLLALLAMAFAVFAGLWSAWSDAHWSYAWAREIEDREQDAALWKGKKNAWHERKRWGEAYSLFFFAAGVLLAAVYVVLRVFSF